MMFGAVLHRVLALPAEGIDPNAALTSSPLRAAAPAVVSYRVGASAGGAVKGKRLWK
ncbi:hypothetical protein [Azospirillum brasilense]|uniref:hypothetical protein n=1 Tax=Azospirillum brasilense TaxID=192 RepID=UPI001585EE49|nr:hypothetical protein [Azospirillum brasilense]